MRSSAISEPGMFLSQPPRHSTPSMNCDCAAVSIASQITSRDTSEYFMPSVPIEMPSVTVGKPKVCGMAPASDRKSVVQGKSVDVGGRRVIKKKKREGE